MKGIPQKKKSLSPFFKKGDKGGFLPTDTSQHLKSVTDPKL